MGASGPPRFSSSKSNNHKASCSWTQSNWILVIVCKSTDPVSELNDAEIAPNVTSELPKSKKFLGEHAPSPPYSQLPHAIACGNNYVV